MFYFFDSFHLTGILILKLRQLILDFGKYLRTGLSIKCGMNKTNVLLLNDSKCFKCVYIYIYIYKFQAKNDMCCSEYF